MTAFPSGRCGGGREGVCEKRYLITLLLSSLFSVKLCLCLSNTHMHACTHSHGHTQRILGYPKKATSHSNTTEPWFGKAIYWVAANLSKSDNSSLQSCWKLLYTMVCSANRSPLHNLWNKSRMMVVQSQTMSVYMLFLSAECVSEWLNVIQCVVQKNPWRSWKTWKALYTYKCKPNCLSP